MDVAIFIEKIKKAGIHTITGIPDSTLKSFCDYIGNEGKDNFEYHIVPENEGGCIGIAIGEYLATGNPACVYMQNSGLGNAVNPITSLVNSDVYGIPMLFIIGWRGEPETKDEPQHKFMGRITTNILDVLDIPYAIIDVKTTEYELDIILGNIMSAFQQNKQFAILVKRDTFEKKREIIYQNGYSLKREKALERIVKWLHPEDIVVSTTGKISREMYEQSNVWLGNHDQTFLTVGGMGHANMIAYQLANRNSDKKVICIDGDGALLMHLGSMAVIGRNPLHNFIHICLDNEAHESVGGMPTGATGLSYSEIARKCGYHDIYHVVDENELQQSLEKVRNAEMLTFIEVKVSLDSRVDLGRPKETAEENKIMFMRHNGVI